MFFHLIDLFVEHSGTHMYEISMSLFKVRMGESSFLQAHVLKMNEGIERLAILEVERPI